DRVSDFPGNVVSRPERSQPGRTITFSSREPPDKGNSWPLSCSWLYFRQEVCMLDRFFELSAHKTTIRTELLAGLITFLTMAYIIFVQPAVLSGQMFGKP